MLSKALALLQIEDVAFREEGIVGEAVVAKKTRHRGKAQRIGNPVLLIRRLNITVNHVISEDKAQRHPRMSMYNRAAQFSPFAALTGYEKAIEEARKKQEAEVRRRDSPLDYRDEKS